MGQRRVILWAAVAVVGVDLVFFSGASNFLAAAQSRILNQVLVLAVMACLLLAAWRGRVDLRSPLVLPGLAWIAANAVATLLSQRPATSLEALALLLLAAPAYLAVRTVTWSESIGPRLDRLIVAATAVFVLAYLLQATTQWLAWWSVAGPSVPPLRPGDVGLTVGTVNAVSLYLELLAPAGVWLAWTIRRSRALAGVLALLSLAALVVTGSRGAWLGALAGAAGLALLAWLDRGRPMPSLPRERRTRAIAVAGLLIVGGGVLVLGPVLLTRLLSGDAGRVELWSAAWSMFTSSPLAGIGPGGFAHARALTPISEGNLAVLSVSHDSVLQVLADAGILGLLAATWLVAAVARLAIRSIRDARTTDERVLRQIALASLLAMAVHSLVDTQFHLPAVMVLVFLLVARFDPPAVVRADAPVGPAAAPAARARARRTRVPAATGGALVLAGAVALVPIDVAMVRAQLGNLALDRGDAASALADFQAAAGLHELGPYRLGEAIAASRLGFAATADAALERAAAIQPYTFIVVARAMVAGPAHRVTLLEQVEDDGAYDPTATVNAAVLRYPADTPKATEDLSAAMAGAPTLVFSQRPVGLFDDAVWAEAQRRAVDVIGVDDPVMAAAIADLARLPDLADRWRSLIAAGPEADALDLLAASVRTGHADVDRARALLRTSPGSQDVQDVLWLLGFQALAQPLIDDVKAVAVTEFFGTPLPPMELVVDGRTDADWSLRIPRYPQASDGRNGPKRPYLAGMVTIEPVYRPKP